MYEKKFSFVFLSSLGRIFFKCTKKLVPSGSTFMLLCLCSAGPTLQGGGEERVLKEKLLFGQIFNNRFRKWSKKRLPFIQIWPGVGMGFTLSRLLGCYFLLEFLNVEMWNTTPHLIIVLQILRNKT